MIKSHKKLEILYFSTVCSLQSISLAHEIGLCSSCSLLYCFSLVTANLWMSFGVFNRLHYHTPFKIMWMRVHSEKEKEKGNERKKKQAHLLNRKPYSVHQIYHIFSLIPWGPKHTY